MNPCDIRTFSELEKSMTKPIPSVFASLAYQWSDSFKIDQWCRQTVHWAWRFVDMENRSRHWFFGGPNFRKMFSFCVSEKCTNKCCIQTSTHKEDWFGRRICQNILWRSNFRSDFLFAWRVWPYIFTIWTAMAHTASRPMLYLTLLDSLGSNQFEQKMFKSGNWLIQTEVLNVENSHLPLPLQDAFLDALAQRSMAVAFSMKPVGLARTVWRGIMENSALGFGYCSYEAPKLIV